MDDGAHGRHEVGQYVIHQHEPNQEPIQEPVQIHHQKMVDHLVLGIQQE